MLSGTNKTNSLLGTSLVHFLSPFSLSPLVAPLTGMSRSVSNTTSLNPVWSVNLLFVFNSWVYKKAFNPLMFTFVILSPLPIHWLPSMNLFPQKNLSSLCYGVYDSITKCSSLQFLIFLHFVTLLIFMLVC